MKNIEVVAGVIVRNSPSRENALEILATERGYGDFKGFWEFPGGKVEPGETREQALARELREELQIEVSVDRFICTVEHDYPEFHLVMHCFYCRITGGNLVLLVHDSAKWVTEGELTSLNWCPADVKVVSYLV